MPEPRAKGSRKPLDPLIRNQLIGGVCAALVVLFACIRIFVLKASADGVFVNLMSIANAVLSLVVLTSAVRVMLSASRTRSFEEVLAEKCREIDRRYGALIEASDEYQGDDWDGATYSIADNVDAIFTTTPEQWGSLAYREKFAFSPDFSKTRVILYYVSHEDMAARSARLGDSPETTARLLARDMAIAIQRSFSDILVAHALELTHEEGRAVVTIRINSTDTAEDATRIAELIDYLLFLHFIAT